jgi:hypothetical protein
MEPQTYGVTLLLSQDGLTLHLSSLALLIVALGPVGGLLAYKLRQKGWI